MSLWVREIKDTDHPIVVKLINRSYRGEESLKGWTSEATFLSGQRIDESLLKKELSPEANMLCLFDNTKLIGCVYLKIYQNPKEDICYLGMLTIDPNIQAKGHGKFLLSKAEEYAKQKKAKLISLGVIYLRTELINWYERRGYKKTGQTKKFPYGQPEFGIPNQDGLYFCMMEKFI
ncbi:MAG: GNAT family N-acetyltransferase [Oligoflexia bacterium]|nr:GNAT family N-acetyltransferase [Oligoflexia bacterium]